MAAARLAMPHWLSRAQDTHTCASVAGTPVGVPIFRLT
jgi:hypothetical protein